MVKVFPGHGGQELLRNGSVAALKQGFLSAAAEGRRQWQQWRRQHGEDAGRRSHVIGMAAKSCSCWCPGVSFYRDVEKDGKLLGKSIYTWIQTVGIFHIYVSLEEGKYW